MRKFVVGPLLLAASPILASPVWAQDMPTVYMGIDLTAEPEPVPQANNSANTGPEERSVGIHLRGLLDEGVELGCLTFDPPASFSQTDNASEECREYMSRLAAATSDDVEILPEPETRDDPWSRVPLVTLAQGAQSGNKRAQLELGIRFEEGTGGVEPDWANALELYRLAARHTPAVTGIAVNSASDPSVFAGEGGTLGRRQLSRRVPGLRDARDRLEALEARIAAGEGS